MNVWRVPYTKIGAGPGLERLGALAEHLGIDLAAFGKTGAVVVGSNGKGSTAAMTAAILRQASETVGLFTSPHMLALNERFRIGDDDISDAELDHHWRHVVGAIEALGLADAIGGFEFLFLIAADWFSARGCTYTVWEAGLGGRLDPVRMIESQRTALTSLDLEHTELLGPTLADIALEKIAAARPGTDFAISTSVAAEPKALDAIETWCKGQDVNLTIVQARDSAPLAGAHQRSNAALAAWLARSTVALIDEQVDSGLAAVRWPGRLEVLSDDPLEIVDAGHTPAAVSAALTAFETMRGGRRAVFVCGVSRNKEAEAIVSRLAPAFSTVICVAAHHKGAPAARIAAHVQAANPNAEITLADSVADARRLALAKAQDGAIYVAGGLFLATEYKAVHLGRDPASLVFF